MAPPGYPVSSWLSWRLLVIPQILMASMGSPKSSWALSGSPSLPYAHAHKHTDTQADKYSLLWKRGGGSWWSGICCFRMGVVLVLELELEQEPRNYFWITLKSPEPFLNYSEGARNHFWITKKGPETIFGSP